MIINKARNNLCYAPYLIKFLIYKLPTGYFTTLFFRTITAIIGAFVIIFWLKISLTIILVIFGNAAASFGLQFAVLMLVAGAVVVSSSGLVLLVGAAVGINVTLYLRLAAAYFFLFRIFTVTGIVGVISLSHIGICCALLAVWCKIIVFGMFF